MGVTSAVVLEGRCCSEVEDLGLGGVGDGYVGLYVDVGRLGGLLLPLLLSP